VCFDGLDVGVGPDVDVDIDIDVRLCRTECTLGFALEMMLQGLGPERVDGVVLPNTVEELEAVKEHLVREREEDRKGLLEALPAGTTVVGFRPAGEGLLAVMEGDENELRVLAFGWNDNELTANTPVYVIG